ncbi:hypothetical protein L198_07296 [Cryptococcus wingfieldii CBS 7118]|uniref:Uncharacterized protein n=1 Tax=Cryptococcus wingfieldii CBS 7118 TaxID=1295528 RepID=A0A1E3IFU2_9TREE|nr:hypothetical protein L198_07296 [Cryptococcus wingfieldii CBS 7118]ODN86601.1 hypothetical protein L198_07296 [Cryptococcus wingfieldii CBS 7118]
MTPPRPLTLAFACLVRAACLSTLFLADGPQTEFTFQWPDETRECDVVELTWSGGKAPFEVWLIPVFGQPFILSIPDSYYVDGQGSYPIELQISNGYIYTVMMSDANGIGTGGTSEAFIVQPMLSNTTNTTNTTTSPSPSPSSCLRSASLNSTSLDFTFTLSGSLSQCSPGLEIAWTGGEEMGPYNYTLVPLDRGFMGWTVKVPGSGEGGGEGWLDDWVVNMTAGTRFTMIMSTKTAFSALQKGYGRGGVAGAYKISPSHSTSSGTGTSNDTDSDTSCNLVQPPLPTGSWPASAVLNTLPTASLSPSSNSSSSSNSSASDPDEVAAAHRRATAGRIAGTVLGVLLGVGLCDLGGWFWRRSGVRRRLGPVGRLGYLVCI